MDKDAVCMCVCVGVCLCVGGYVYNYQAIKMNEIMPFTATQMNIDIITLSEVSQRQISCGIINTYEQNLKNGTDELTYKTEIDSQTWLLKSIVMGYIVHIVQSLSCV